MATSQKDKTIIIDLELLNSGNAQGCAACHRKFSLGDIAVMACGFWETGPQLVHRNEAVYDTVTDQWMERTCHKARYMQRTPL